MPKDVPQAPAIRGGGDGNTRREVLCELTAVALTEERVD